MGQPVGVRFPLVAPKLYLFSTCPCFQKFANIPVSRMKGIKLLFAVCLAPLVFQTATADVTPNTTRTANRRTTAVTTTNPRRGTAVTTRDTVTQRGTTARSRTATTRTRNTSAKNVSARTTTTPTISHPTSTNTRTGGTTPRPAVARTSVTTRSLSPAMRTRAADANVVTRDEIISRDYKKCRTVFYDCMDEFCANKDSDLKRCACSTRINEFRGNKENLAMVEEKLLDFGQRLLTVSMDKEDAAALNVATEGELAFNQKDTSQSKKMLDEIAKKLNTSFDDSNFDQGLNAISLSLNPDAAFDSLDPTAGASTTTKSGTALYSASLPICREMAMEFCSTEELAIAEGGYQMMIEQDCNTVKKSYQTQADQARTKVFESGALLDMSRLNVHQERNSDDILTCKNKMLTMLTDSTVCGTNMEKCLDTSGQYIDPTTGEAFLTTNLSNLATLITRPTRNETWSEKNTRYVSFLNSKKKFLEPAMEKCQDIADTVWTSFIEDALSQIKIAQDAKLESVRQSCTTLVAQCTNDALKSIEDFDARAISIFGINADKTANAMCADIKSTCTALFRATDTKSDTPEWESGINEITNQKTYETILSTCREVGRNCIIQACTSITGNFGLCENIDTSINRKAIVNRTACWDEVVECVASAGTENIKQIMAQQGRIATATSGDLYTNLYNISRPKETTEQTIYDICTADNDICVATETPECQICRIAEQIWGNCDKAPTDNTSIILGTHITDTDTLLTWFAKNTGTTNIAGNCRSTKCPPGKREDKNTHLCADESQYSSDGELCPTESGYRITVTETGITNCCNNNATKIPHTAICCRNATSTLISDPFFPTNDSSLVSGTICAPNAADSQIATTYTAKYAPSDTENYTNYKYTLICVNGTIHVSDINNPTDTFPAGQNLDCSGEYFLIDEAGHYLNPSDIRGNSVNTHTVTNYYIQDGNTKCEYHHETNEWYINGDQEQKCITPQSWQVEFK